MSLPERINAIKTITYEVQSIVDTICDFNKELSKEEVTIEMVLDWVDEMVHEDFLATRKFYLTNEDGEEL
jgi:hypothetical protein